MLDGQQCLDNLRCSGYFDITMCLQVYGCIALSMGELVREYCDHQNSRTGEHFRHDVDRLLTQCTCHTGAAQRPLPFL